MKTKTTWDGGGFYVDVTPENPIEALIVKMKPEIKFELWQDFHTGDYYFKFLPTVGMMRREFAEDIEKLFSTQVPKETSMTFSEALGMVRNGFQIARKGWNGKGQYVFYMRGYPDGVVANELTRQATGEDIVKVQPYLAMMTVQGTIVPWTVSQTDLLATDWTANPNSSI